MSGTLFSLTFLLFCILQSSKGFETFPLNIEEMKHQFKTDRPVIGIVTMPILGKRILTKLNLADKHLKQSHIGASFVKLIEGAGARVVPVLETFNDTQVKSILKSVNGFLLPGGSESIIDSDYKRISELAYDYSIKMYKEGITWPILGICRGFQMLLLMESNGKCLTPTDALNLTVPLEFTKDAKKSRLFGNASAGIITILENEKITYNAHKNGITLKDFRKFKKLRKRWRIISNNKDRNGVDFISTFEGKKYPMYGIQWHPEKMLYVWNSDLDINHSVHGMMVAQYMANFFICEARKNSNKFATEGEEEHRLIYQFEPTYVGNIEETAYEQIYMWKRYT